MGGFRVRGSGTCRGWGVKTKRQIAFRVQTDAAILGADCVLAGGADAYPAPPAPPCHHPKFTASFSPKGTKCNLRFASFCPGQNDFRGLSAFCRHDSSFIILAGGSPPWRDVMEHGWERRFLAKARRAQSFRTGKKVHHGDTEARSFEPEEVRSNRI